MKANKFVYLKPLNVEHLEAPLMRFRLVYEGELKSSQKDPIGGQNDRLAEHKHALRKAFHRQLKQLWKTNRFLREHEVFPSDYFSGTSTKTDIAQFSGDRGKETVPLSDALAALYKEHGYRFVPLVREDASLLCSLDILFLRKDYPGSVIEAGDLDNRIKTLIDGLRRPRNAAELRGNEIPSKDEDPFFCLLEDDKSVTGLKVETDTLLDSPVGDIECDNRQVKLIITVDIRPYHVTMFNLNFS